MFFGIWESGVGTDLTNVLFQKDFNDLFHMSTTTWMKITTNSFDQDKSQYNNYFINVIKNFGGHLFMNCEAGSLYPDRARLEEAQIKTCFNDYHDLMVAARIGKECYIRQIAGYCTENDT